MAVAGAVAPGAIKRLLVVPDGHKQAADTGCKGHKQGRLHFVPPINEGQVPWPAVLFADRAAGQGHCFRLRRLPLPAHRKSDQAGRRTPSAEGGSRNRDALRDVTARLTPGLTITMRP